MDTLQLLGLRLDAAVGVYAHEHNIQQPIEIDVSVEVPLGSAARTDSLDHTVDYDQISRICRDVIDERHHDLIESIAEEIAARVLATWARVRRVTVRVEKPGAVARARTAAVVLVRTRTRPLTRGRIVDPRASRRCG